MDKTSQVVDAVTMISDLGVALICDVEGRRTIVPRALVLAGSEVLRPGECGRLVIPHELAFDLGLAEQAVRVDH